MRSLGMPQGADHVLIEHDHAAAGDGPHRQLFVARQPELADEEDVERCVQGPGDLVGDRHAAPGQRQHDDVRTVGVCGQLLGQEPAGLAAIGEDHGSSPHLVRTDRPYTPQGYVSGTFSGSGAQVERVKCAGLVDVAEGVVAAGEHGRHVVAEPLVLGVVHHADGAVPALLEEVARCPGRRRTGAACPSSPARCRTSSQLPSRAGGTGISSIGASHSRPAITVPRCDPKPTRTTPSSPCRSRTSWPTLTMPSSAMSVKRASPMWVLCSQTMARRPARGGASGARGSRSCAGRGCSRTPGRRAPWPGSRPRRS